MKSLLTLLIMICPLFVGFLAAQDTPPQKPADIGVAEFDTFKNNAFTILSQASRADSDIVRLDNEVKTYSGVMASANKEKLEKDYKAVLELNKYRKTLVDNVGKLDEEGKGVMQKAKSLSPLKSKGAIANTNKSIKGLDYSRQHLTNAGALLKADANTISTELKKRGAKVEDFVE